MKSKTQECITIWKSDTDTDAHRQCWQRCFSRLHVSVFVCLIVPILKKENNETLIIKVNYVSKAFSLLMLLSSRHETLFHLFKERCFRDSLAFWFLRCFPGRIESILSVLHTDELFTPCGLVLVCLVGVFFLFLLSSSFLCMVNFENVALLCRLLHSTRCPEALFVLLYHRKDSVIIHHCCHL